MPNPTDKDELINQIKKLRDLVGPYLKHGVYEDWYEFIAETDQLYILTTNYINQRIHQELEPANQLLRSAYAVAKRDGKGVNWQAFRTNLEDELNRELATLKESK